MKLKAEPPKETESKPGLKSDAENDLKSAPLPELETGARRRHSHSSRRRPLFQVTQ